MDVMKKYQGELLETIKKAGIDPSEIQKISGMMGGITKS
jgi:hypothetical protein